MSALRNAGAMVPGLPASWAELAPGALSRRQFSVQGATLLLMATFLASAILGAVRQVLLGAHFGATETTGAFEATSRLPDILFTLIAGGALSSALLPVLSSERLRGGNAAAWRLISMVLNALLLGLVSLSLLGMLFAPLFVRFLLLPGYSAEAQDIGVTMTRVMLLQPAVLGAGTVITAWLNSQHRFFLPAIGVACHNAGILSGIGLAMLVPEIGIWGPVWGVVGGAILQVTITALGLVGERPREQWVPRIDPHDPGLRAVAVLLIPNGLSTGVNYAGWMVEAAFGTTVADERTVLALTNGWLMAGLSVTLLGAAIGQAAFPRLAAYFAAGSHDAFRRLALGTLAVAVGGSLPAAALLLGGGDLVAELLFGHGEYDDQAVRLTADVMAVYALGLPAYIGTEIASRTILAMRDARTPLLTNTLQLLVRTAIIATLLPVWGVLAIPLAYVVSSAIEAAILVTLAWRRSGRRAGFPAPA
ncbi:MAG TPA: lipid II flippase MurJ [Thermomicrobiales bacterium]|nr:lipid II flippase MurJ [Thermomicrobiales bacterium]